MTAPRMARTFEQLWQQGIRSEHRLNERTHGWLGLLAGAARETLKPDSAITAAAIAYFALFTFFFNGGDERVFEGEDRILVPSPKFPTYDLQPEMSAPEVTDRLVEAIDSGKYDLIVCNYANGDMVGHTGNIPAAIKAVECIDTCLDRLAETIKRQGGVMLVTANHGNAEQMFDSETGQPTRHTP